MSAVSFEGGTVEDRMIALAHICKNINVMLRVPGVTTSLSMSPKSINWLIHILECGCSSYLLIVLS
jgi:hypothetical protein